MIKGILIDFGGTIDSDGIHWFNAFREGYSVVQDMPEDVLRESYVYAERTLGRNQIITPDYSFCKTLQTKIVLQTQFLNSKGILFTKQDVFTRSIIVETSSIRTIKADSVVTVRILVETGYFG